MSALHTPNPRQVIIERLAKGGQPTVEEALALIQSDPACAAALNVAVGYVAQRARRRLPPERRGSVLAA